jgi:tRNA-dihydrouridine synthase 2
MNPLKVVFSTIPNERVVLQIGTCNAGNALKVANLMASSTTAAGNTTGRMDIRALDINMGCPVHFSTAGGMGSALLSKPELIRDILTTLTRNYTPDVLPITCKIRLLETESKTLELVKMIANCGVSAIGIHARHIPDRPRHKALTEWYPPALELNCVR